MSYLAAALASGSDSTSTLSNVEPGALGFLVVVGMGLALFFLLKNMNKQFKKLGPPPGEANAGEANAGEAVQKDTVRTGDAEQDEKAEGTAKRQ